MRLNNKNISITLFVLSLCYFLFALYFLRDHIGAYVTLTAEYDSDSNHLTLVSNEFNPEKKNRQTYSNDYFLVQFTSKSRVDCDVIVKEDGKERYRARINSPTPAILTHSMYKVEICGAAPTDLELSKY